MAKLPLPSGISWLCHFVCPELRPGVAHRSRRYVLACQRLAARSACVCVCVYQQRDAARCKVWPSASLSFHFSLLAAEVHVTECPRRQTTLSLSLNCMLCIFFFFFFLSALLIEDKVVFSQVAATPFVATAILALYHRVITSNHSM